MTGARIPENATAIIPKEDTQKLNDNKIKIIKNVKEFQHIRFIGEDIKKNELLLNKGDLVNFSKVTLLASTNIKILSQCFLIKLNIYSTLHLKT